MRVGANVNLNNGIATVASVLCSMQMQVCGVDRTGGSANGPRTREGAMKRFYISEQSSEGCEGSNGRISYEGCCACASSVAGANQMDDPVPWTAYSSASRPANL